ncbi:MAG: hypothetical protein HYT13_02005 [Candidatus Liptonbacteria bacterium]|nr:hypothetical protein [Candidatus Liptonbacteria bacterium]
MLNIFRGNKKPKDFQKLLKPSPDFVRRTGFLFLSAFSQKFSRDSKPEPSAFRYFVRGLASGVALMLIISGGAAYADQRNVGPDNLLYPLKRAQELINLTLSNAEEKPVLHLKLAERRLEEIEEVKQKDPLSGKIFGLSDDLREELHNSVGALNGDEIEDIQVEKLENKLPVRLIPPPQPLYKSTLPTSTATSTQPIKSYNKSSFKKQVFTEKSGPSICASFRALITSQSLEVREVIGENPKLIEKFEKKCLQKIEESSGDELKIERSNKGNQEKQEIPKVEENKNFKND